MVATFRVAAAYDDATLALLVALAELGSINRAFNPRQPRIPKGSPGGGRFRSMVDHLKEVIEQHLHEGRNGHPLADFTREQLRRVAKARRIPLERGESRDSIAAKLLEHLREARSGGTASRRRNAGTDQESWVRDNAARVVAAIPHSDGGDGGLDLVSKRQGFDGPPDVVGSAGMDRAVAAGWRELWRGVDPGASVSATSKSARQINDEFRDGGFFPGLGFYGNGTYTSVNREVGEVYAGKTAPAFVEDLGPGAVEDGGLLRLALDPDARVGDYEVLLKEQEEYLHSQPQAVQQALADLGRYAAMRGYDAYVVTGQTDGSDIENPASGRDDYDQYVILNRTAVKVQREDP